MRSGVLVILLLATVFVFGFAWTFLETPRAFVLKDGIFQFSSLNVFSQNSMILGMGNFSEIGIVDSSFLEQIQVLKKPFDLSVGMRVGFDENSSFFLAVGEKTRAFEFSSAISYDTPRSSETSITFYALAGVPTQIGNVRLEYKKSSRSNLLAVGIVANFSANEKVRWLFRSLSVGVGMGWDFNNVENFYPSNTYFVFQYTR